MVTSVNNIIYGGPVGEKETTNYNSLGDYILKKLKEKWNNVILIDGITGVEYTGSYLYEQVVRLAFCFQRLNIKEGDIVAISCESRIEYATVLYATMCVNATFLPLNVANTQYELSHSLKKSMPSIIFVTEQSIEKISNAIKGMNIRHAFLFGSNLPIKGFLPFNKLMTNKGIISGHTFIPKTTNPEQNVAILSSSSGTTGLPKQVEITQKNLLSYIDEHTAFYNSSEIMQGRILCVIPWTHIYGLMRLFLTCSADGCLVFLPKFEERRFLESIQKFKIAICLLVPPLMVWLSKTPLLKEYDLSSLKLLTCGAAPLSKAVEEAVKERLGLKLILQGYGLTETTGGIIFQTETHHKPGSIGTVNLGSYAKVIDPDTGKLLGPFERGELCLKSDCLMRGYKNDAAASKESIRDDGWLYTGDIVYYDDDLEFFVVDRIKELIKYKGLQVAPAELEALLLTHPMIKDAAVIGKPDELAGELPCAFVAKQDGSQLTEKDVYDFVAERTSFAKKLRGGVTFVPEVPKSPSGKILRRVLREKYLKPKSKL